MWKERKNLNGILKAELAPWALSLSVCRAGEVWPQVQPANACDPELTLEGTRRSLNHTSSAQSRLILPVCYNRAWGLGKRGGGLIREESQSQGLGDRQTDKNGW